MTYTVTAQFDVDANSSQMVLCHLVEINFAGGTVRLCDLNMPVTFNGFIYDGIGTLGAIEPVRSASGAEVVGQRLTLSGVPTAAIALVNNELYSNRPISIYVARFNKVTYLIDEVVRVFNGLVSHLAMTESKSENGRTRVVSLTAEDKSVLLTRSRGRRSNNEDHRSEYPNDGFFKKVAQGSQTELVWPSKEAQAQYA